MFRVQDLGFMVQGLGLKVQENGILSLEQTWKMRWWLIGVWVSQD